MEGERDRVDRAGDEIRPGARSLERRGEPAPRSPLAVEPDGKPAPVREHRDELVGPVRLERPRRIVQQDTRRSEIGELLRLLDELLLAARAGAVDEALRRTPGRPR